MKLLAFERQHGPVRMSAARLLRVLSGMAIALFAAIGATSRNIDVVATNPQSDRRIRSAPFADGPAALFWPGAIRSFFISPDGSLDNGEWTTRIQTYSDGIRDSSSSIVRYAAPAIPIACWSRRDRGIQWDFEAAILPGLPDSFQVASLNIIAKNHSGSARLVRVVGEFVQPPRVLGFVAPDAPESVLIKPTWAGRNAEAIVMGWFGTNRSTPSADITWRIEPAARKSVRLLVPTHATRTGTLDQLALMDHAASARTVARNWSALLDSGVTLSLHHREAEVAFRAAVGVLLGCTERSNEFLIPIGNPFQYRDVWLRDGARSAAALAMAGHIGVAAEFVQGFLDYQWPNGAFLSQRGQLDGTGHVLWAFGQVLLRDRADRDLRPYLEASMRAWHWCESQRASTQILGLTSGGLLPPSEPRDNEMPHGLAQFVGNDAWTIAGYSALERLLIAGARPVDASAVRAARERYVTRFRAALDSMRVSEIPPTWQGRGNDWGNLATAYPCKALSPYDHRLRATLQRVWRQSPVAGLIRYGSHDTVHTYLAADPACTELLAGESERSEKTLLALLHWRTPSGGSPELFAFDSLTFGKNYPPHATAAAALISLIRSMLISDDDDTLRLTLGPLEQWWRGGKIRRAPTRWGRLDLAFASSASSCSWRWSPVPAPTLVRLPRGYQVVGRLPPGGMVLERGQAIVVPPFSREIVVRVARAQWMRDFSSILSPACQATAAGPRRGSSTSTPTGEMNAGGSPLRATPATRLSAMAAEWTETGWYSHSLRAEQLFDSAMRVVDRLGVRGPQVSVSTRRIALFRNAMAQLDSAESQPQVAAVQAVLRVQRARILEVGGFLLDALGWYRSAAAADPTNFEARMGLERTTGRLLSAASENGPDP